MTIEDEHPPGRGARPTAHELARYERLFAARTRGMRSSAMREMMALTERPDVISLAGGLPDTSTFPPELYAKLMAHVAADSTARALQYGPTEGMTVTMECIVQVMAEEGTAVDADEMIVTTGGQQVIDLVCKTLIDPGDVIVAEAPTYPGAVPTFGAYQADVVQIEMDEEGMPIDELEATLDRLQAENRRPKFIYTIPNFQNPGGVTMSLERRRRLVKIARERELLVLEDNPYGLLRYEGTPLPTLYSLDAANSGRRGASDLVIYLGTFSKILSPGLRLGWAVAPRPVLEKLNLGKQGSDLCSSPVTQLFVAAYFREHDWRGYLTELKDLYRRRRDVMLEALRGALRQESHLDQAPGRPVHLGDAAGVHRHHRPARAVRRGGVCPGTLRVHGWAPWRFVDAAELRRPPRGRDSRGHPADRQEHGRRHRPPQHVDGLLDTLPARGCRDGHHRQGCVEPNDRGCARVAPLREIGEEPPAASTMSVDTLAGKLRAVAGSTGGRARSTRGAHLRVAGESEAKGAVGESLCSRAGVARAHRLAPVRSACPGGAAGARTRCDLDRCRTRAFERVAAKPAGRGIRHAAWPRRRGRHRAGLAGGNWSSLHGLGALGLHALHRQGARQVPDARGRHSHARLSRLQGERDQGARRGGGIATHRARARISDGGQAQQPGFGVGREVRASSEELPAAIVAALSYDRKVLLERYVKGATWRFRCSTPRWRPIPKPSAMPVIEAIPREQDFYAYESRYEIGMTTFVCPAELPAETTARAQDLALQVYRLLGCHGVARVDLMLDEESGELTVLEINVVPGITETSLLPLAAEVVGIDLTALVGRILQSAFTR